MNVALVGSGEYLDDMIPVDRALIDRLAEPARVVCLPTAAGTEGQERVAYWSRLGEEYFHRLGAEVTSLPVLTRDDARDPAHAAAIARANFVYLSGGKPTYLYETLAETPVWTAVAGVPARGGVLAGCSAGAMVLGERFFGFPTTRPGFGLVPGVTVIPHFDEIPGVFTWVMRHFMGSDQTVVGIDGNTALVQNGATYEVLGQGGVTLWKEGEHRRYEAGDLPGDAWPNPSQETIS
jgi:cyanophycinase